ncbi:MFS transporter [Oscillatoria sp. FACHB-1407]|uniref:MFS transporter n=1 Tax=Oscillatoria sp. FACHB-1407 TaxID=2692847 RepID=UPI0016897C7E|nr:MFS transporter [Oscillatoria sp. FACHB-1407]MBD2461251.1 MFS transporter [Oscillatoria sp. FACHB-1407]
MTQVSSRVLWLQVWGLAAVQGAIALVWVIYNLYLIALLEEFGFSATLATGLLILENGLAAVMEPLMGSLSDRAQQWIGSRFPFIAVGIILAATCSIAIPTIAIFGLRSPILRWLMPAVLVAWALAMTVFRSPALSLLGRYALATQLPQAASILTLVGGLAGALGPLASGIILGLGPMVAFSIGAFVLLGAAVALRSVSPNQQVQAQANTASPTQAAKTSHRISLIALGLLLGAGVGVGLGFRLLMQNFPKILVAQGVTQPSLIVGMIFITLALTAIPAGRLAVYWGNRTAMVAGLGAMALLCAVMLWNQPTWIAVAIAIAFGAAFSLVSNGTLPFALSMVPPDKGGLGTGMYFSGGAIANSVFGSFFGTGDSLSPTVGGITAAIAFAVAGLCVLATFRLRQMKR